MDLRGDEVLAWVRKNHDLIQLIYDGKVCISQVESSVEQYHIDI